MTALLLAEISHGSSNNVFCKQMKPLKPMSRMILALLAMATSTFAGEPPPDDLVKKLTAVIREHCPDASITVTNGLFTAKYGTMMFALHRRSMTGEISPKTYEEEGPNFKGFLLTVTIEQGHYDGQAVVPQELHGPYFPTYINGPATADGTNHYWITYSYGGGLDPKLKQAVFSALPRGGLPDWYPARLEKARDMSKSKADHEEAEQDIEPSGR